MQLPLRHFSLKAQSLSDKQTGRHMLLSQWLPAAHSMLEEQETGTASLTRNYVIMPLLFQAKRVI